VSGLGEFFIDKLDVPHVESWREGMGTLVSAGDYSPTTVNGWLAVLRVIMKAAKREFRLAHLDALVTRSISGHLTERMQHHYSTVNSDEQRQGIAKVIELTKASTSPSKRASAAACSMATRSRSSAPSSAFRRAEARESIRHHDGDGLPSVAAVYPEILIEGHHRCVAVELRHPHETGIGKRHRDARVFRHQLAHHLEFRR